MEESVLITCPVETEQKDGRAVVSPYLVAQGEGLMPLFWWLLLLWIIETGLWLPLCGCSFTGTYIGFFAKCGRVTLCIIPAWVA